MYSLIPDPTAYALMALITVSAGLLALRLEAMLVAIFGVIGGYITPLVLSTTTKQLPFLYIYILLLGAGTLYIAKHKDWKLLNFLAFVFSYTLFFISLANYDAATDFPIVITFLTINFALFALMPIFHHIIHREKSTLLALISMLANLAAYLIPACTLITKRFSHEWAAIVTLVLATFYIVQIRVFMKRTVNDRNLFIILCSFTAFLISISVPLLLSGAQLTAAWALIALTLLWMSLKMNNPTIRNIAYLFYSLAFIRFMSYDFWQNLNISDGYLNNFLSRFTSMGVISISMFAASKLLSAYSEKEESNLEASELEPQGSTHGQLFYWVSALFLFVFFQIEFHFLSNAYYIAMHTPLITAVWVAAIIAIIYKFQTKETSNVLNLIFALSVIALIKVLILDPFTWELSMKSPDGGLSIIALAFQDFSLESLTMRFINYAMIIAVFAWAAKQLKTKKLDMLDCSQMLNVFAVLLLFLYTTLEMNTIMANKIPGMQAGAVSILWSIFALSAIIIGIKKDIKGLRYAGLSLFLITSLKVFFSDLSTLSQVYRIVAFLIFGLIMLSGSFIYIKFQDRFKQIPEGELHHE
ncbi:MAG: DUF2339 domain-containing protein [Lentisphaeria bacterium]|nr:DUF2339 domain-containing protein [Lentisphaeria bacterium]NQZ68716.1 DUF2339 domain-containing protein [Lentisphaeria bacterium]